MNPKKGWFSIVQFCPDPNRLESANIGVLLFCPALSFLDVRVATDNHRIIKFFGPLKPDWQFVDSFKKGLADRVRRESRRIVDHEQLLDFVDRRANMIRISPPRSIRITEPQKQIDELFAELVGGVARRSARTEGRLAACLEQPGLKQKLYKSVPITVPIDGRQLHVPYAFQNGRFNLIQPVGFQSENALQTAYKYAVEGDSLYETEHEDFGRLKLLVVGRFRGKDDENKQIVRRVLANHHVSLFAMDDVGELVNEILVTGKDRPVNAKYGSI